MFDISPKSRRLELQAKNETPKQSEIKNYIGPILTTTLCDFSPPDIQKLLGVTPQLEGPPKNLWTPPSDKIILRPVTNHNIIKALTHDGILNLGEQVKRNYEADVNKRVNDNLNREINEIRSMFEAEKRHAINLSINETRNVYESKIDLLTKEHESKLQSALAEVVEKSNKKLQKAVVAERVSVTHQMLKKLRDEIGYMVIKLYDEFERKSRVDRENMIADFNKTIRNERNKNNDILNAFEKEKNLEMNIQRLEIENKYLNLLINSVRAERSHSENRMSFRQQNFQEKIQALYELLVKTLYIIKVLNKKLSQPTARIHEPSWRDKLQEIISKFKKMINFVFHAIPGHAEFLLSLESLLSLEHHEDRIACENEDSNRCVLGIIKNFSGSLKNDVFRVVEIVDKNGKKWRPVTLPYQPSVDDEDEPLFIPEIILYHYIDDVLSDDNFPIESNDEIDNDVRTFEELTEEDNFKIQIMDSDINLQNSRESIASDKRKSSVTTPDDVIQHKIRTSLRKAIEIITKLKEEFPSSEPQFSKHEDETERILLDLMKYSNDLKNV